MARGGMYDQLAGGFARYSVDARWIVPHFEKMLYDNAQLLGTYAEAWARDPALFSLMRQLEAYEAALGEDDLVVLPAESAALRVLREGP
jgi:uncharacterized protein YyaL (SSP411 family)